MTEWRRYAKPGEGYEVSSRGDKRFSAFYARLSSSLTIEQAYQTAKGSGKGRPSIHENFDYWGTYLSLWKQWASENPDLIAELRVLTLNKILTDQFANTQNNQARALAEILNAGWE